MRNDNMSIRQKYILVIIFFSISCCMLLANEQVSKSDTPISVNAIENRLKVPLEERLSLEIAGVSIVPHYVSGEIPNYSDETKYLSNYTPGALIRIFVRNTNSKTSIFPEVQFNGKTGQELIKSNVVSYCDVPDIRENITKMSTEIPPKAIDCYTLNVVDGNFNANKITLKFTDKKTARTTEEQIAVKSPDFYVPRIAFASSKGSCFPDELFVYFNNDSENDVSVNNVTIWKARKTYSEHWWSDTFAPEEVKWFGEQGKIPAKGMNGACLNTGVLPFGEIVLEFDINRQSSVEKMYYAVKPVITNFDIGMGWGVKYLAGSEAFCKTIKFMHFNCVNGDTKAFLANKEWSEKYPMKQFSRLLEEAASTEAHVLKYIHGSECFGEPQFDKKPAQGIFNFYTAYRNSGFPTTLTLSHEPGFYLYAGVVDFAHFDAYRVVAPHADKWGDYKKYGNKNVKWGAPLETIGDYMRTLNRISYPNPAAAWTQAMAGDWTSRFRINAGNPNNLEMRIQAYEAVANGAASLYWFNMSGKNLINNRNSLAEIQRVNRELMVVSDLLAKTMPFWWQNRFMDIDLNVLAGPDFAVLFAIDLQYQISETNQFVSAGKRSETMKFKLPAYLQQCNAAVKAAHDGITPVNIELMNGMAVITDTFETTGMYILYNSKNKDLRNILSSDYEGVIATEASYKFNPINNDADFKILTDEVQKIK